MRCGRARKYIITVPTRSRECAPHCQLNTGTNLCAGGGEGSEEKKRRELEQTRRGIDVGKGSFTREKSRATGGACELGVMGGVARVGPWRGWVFPMKRRGGWAEKAGACRGTVLVQVAPALRQEGTAHYEQGFARTGRRRRLRSERNLFSRTQQYDGIHESVQLSSPAELLGNSKSGASGMSVAT